MILVTIGTTKNKFNRLLIAVEKLIEEGFLSNVFAQIGTSSYTPKNCKYKRYVSKSELEEYITGADFIISHAGTGTLELCLGLKKKVIVMPRIRKFREHPDNHQLELASYLLERNRILVAHNMYEIREHIRNINNWTPTFKDNETNHTIAGIIEEFICKTHDYQ